MAFLLMAFLLMAFLRYGIFTLWHFYLWHFYVMAFLRYGIFTYGIFTLWHFYVMAFLRYGIFTLWHFYAARFHPHKVALLSLLFDRRLPSTLAPCLPAHAPWYLPLDPHTITRWAPFSQLGNGPNQYGITQHQSLIKRLTRW